MEKEKYYKTSEITGRKYDVFQSIKILNISQAIYYLENEITLYDLFVSYDKKNNKPVLVFVFLKEDTKQIFDKWCKRGE